MTAHVHQWLRDTTRNRFRCDCGVQAHAPSIMGGQHRGAKTKVIPYLCSYRPTKAAERCGHEAVHVECDRQRNRCAEHAPAKTVAA